MNGERRNSRDNNDENPNNNGLWGWIGAAAAGVAAVTAVAGAIHYAKSQQNNNHGMSLPEPRPLPEPEGDTIWSSLTDMIRGLIVHEETGIPRSKVPDNPVITNLNSLLSDIYVRHVALKQEDCELYYHVFCQFFKQMQEKMNEADPYYKKYSSRKQFAGSHYDGLRIKKLDEFDMDIVVGLPLDFKVNLIDPDKNDINIEHKSPGFVQLKMGTQYSRLPYRDDWVVNKTAYEWKDNRDYLLRSKFIRWFKSTVQRGLNAFPVASFGRPIVYVDGLQYTIRTSESGPAITMYIERPGFRLDIDFVPALKFPESRWPICRGYRTIPLGCNREDWMVVPKLNKGAKDNYEEDRSWRVALHDQEKRLMYNLNNLKITIKLMKKLRDAQGMKSIASYYIKTLFFWEIVERNSPGFWNNDPGFLFKIMVKKFRDALSAGTIYYFWNKENNLIGGVSSIILAEYVRKLDKLLEILDQPHRYKETAAFLLTREEYQDYNRKFLHI